MPSPNCKFRHTKTLFSDHQNSVKSSPKSRKWHFRDSKFKNFLGPSALAFSPPPQSKKSFLRHCYPYQHFHFSFVDFICIIQLLLIKLLAELSCQQYGKFRPGIEVTAQPEIFIFSEPRFPTNWANSKFIYSRQFFSLTNHTTECSFRRNTTGFTSSKSSTETLNSLLFETLRIFYITNGNCF